MGDPLTALPAHGDNGPSPAHDVSAYLAAVEEIAEQLQALPATGPNGFEGLVADALATLSGLEVRLAKSGLQQGRDGSSPAASFAIAFEAKRYERNLRLEDVAAKAWSAAHELAGVVDLWALCATSEAGDETVRKLDAMLDACGITLLMLDWAERPLPPLAVALAAAAQTTLDWFARHHSAIDRVQLAGQLAQIAAHPAFPYATERLRLQLHAAHVGMDTLRRKSSAWLHARLTDRGRAQDTFGQFVAVADPSTPAVRRETTLHRLTDAVALAESGPHPAVVAVLGEEGIGKTWTAAQWLLDTPDDIVPLWIGGPWVQHVVPDDPIETLARVLAAQHDTGFARGLERWRQRIVRWRRTGPQSLPSTGPTTATPMGRRFLVVLDGLNEHPDVRWDAAIRTLGTLVGELGGVLLVTCRPHFWRGEVKPRLGPRVAVAEVTIGGYDDGELTQVLAEAGVETAAVSERVRAFVRNPRVCAVAVRLLDRLVLAPDDLTVDRLLLEYWHARLEERGGHLLHNVDAFHELLRRHAREWLHGERTAFDRDDVAEYSSVAKRRGLDALRQDVSEIEDGRFMTIDAADQMRYTFRHEALPFALGLSLQRELRDAITQPAAARGPRPAPDDVLAGLLDPVQGFDRLSEVLCAAVGLACLDGTYPDVGLRALIPAWLRLQNPGAEALTDEMAAYVALRPEPFFDLAESTHAEFYDGGEAHAWPNLLVARRDAPRVQQGIAARVARWLGLWSRSSASRLPPDVQEERDTRREAERERRLAELNPTELAKFAALTTEVAAAPTLDLVKLTARFLAGRPLAPHAEALLGWALVSAVIPYPTSSSDALVWAVRLNRVDPAALRDAVHALATDLAECASEPMRRALAILLRLLGDVDSVARADLLAPTIVHPGWRRVEQFCDTDPFDPEAGGPTSLDRAHEYVTGLAPTDAWVAMSSTTRDGDLADITPGLARFAPSAIVELLQRVVRTAPERTGMPLRQLAWHLPELSPLFDETCVTAVESAFERLLEDPSRVPERDRHWVLGQFALSVAPYRPGEAHVARVLRLPRDTPMLISLWDGIPVIRAASWSELLRTAYDAYAAGDVDRLTRVLFLLAAPGQPRASELAPEARSIIVAVLASPDGNVAQFAALLIHLAGDEALDDALLRVVAEGRCDERRGDFQFARALAAIVARRSRVDLVSLVNADYLGAAIGGLAEAGSQLAVLYVEHGVSSLLALEVPPAPAGDFKIVVSTTEQGMPGRWAIEENVNGSAGKLSSDLEMQFRERDGVTVGVIDPTASAERFADQRLAFQKAVEQHRAITQQLGAWALYGMPSISAVRRAVTAAPVKAALWIEQVEHATSGPLGWRIRNLGTVLAGAYAERDPEAAARLLRAMRGVDGPVRFRVEYDGVELWDYALFAAPDVPPIAALRREVFDQAATDAALETLITAAEAYRASAWLDGYVEALLGSASAGDQARALAICGLRRDAGLADAVLEREWGGGFLGEVARHARRSRARAAWTATWIARVSATTDPHDYWRFGVLAVGIADARHATQEDQLWTGPGRRRFGPSTLDRLKQASERRTKQRTETLFGQRLWDRSFVATVCGAAADSHGS